MPGATSTNTAVDLLTIGAVLGSGVLLALLGGILAGAVPALLSVRINPAEAIRKLCRRDRSLRIVVSPAVFADLILDSQGLDGGKDSVLLLDTTPTDFRSFARHHFET